MTPRTDSREVNSSTTVRSNVLPTTSVTSVQGRRRSPCQAARLRLLTSRGVAIPLLHTFLDCNRAHTQTQERPQLHVRQNAGRNGIRATRDRRRGTRRAWLPNKGASWCVPCQILWRPARGNPSAGLRSLLSWSVMTKHPRGRGGDSATRCRRLPPPRAVSYDETRTGGLRFLLFIVLSILR